MSGNPVTNADLMRRLVDMEQGLTARLDDHERRITAIEPVAASLRDVLECNAAILRELSAIREAQETAMNEVSKRVEGNLRADVLALRHELRSEMASLRRASEMLTQELRERPCVKGNGGGCVVEETNA